MKLRFTRQAVLDLRQAHAFIAFDNPSAASSVVQRIRDAIDGLLQFPERGRPGRIEGTRELVVPRTPFILPYRIAGDAIDILAIMHAKRAWPESFKG